MKEDRTEELVKCLEAILECDANSELGGLCDEDYGDLYNLFPRKSGFLSDALDKAHELVRHFK